MPRRSRSPKDFKWRIPGVREFLIISPDDKSDLAKYHNEIDHLMGRKETVDKAGHVREAIAPTDLWQDKQGNWHSIDDFEGKRIYGTIERKDRGEIDEMTPGAVKSYVQYTDLKGFREHMMNYYELTGKP